MDRLNGRDPLKVAVSAGMIVGPGDRSRLSIVVLMPRGVGLQVAAVKVVGRPHPAQVTERSSEVLMVPGREETSTPIAKAADGGTFGGVDSRLGIEGEEPELVEIGPVEGGKNGIGPRGRGLPVSGRDDDRPTLDAERLQLLCHEREALDGPVVGPCRGGRLKKNPKGTGPHRATSHP
jgi:hypothetical protein